MVVLLLYTQWNQLKTFYRIVTLTKSLLQADRLIPLCMCQGSHILESLEITDISQS